MKTRALYAIALFGALWNTSSGAYVINDNYIGGSPTAAWFPNQDVIGSPNEFDTQRVEITKSGTVVTFDIYTTFAGNSGNLFSNYTQGGTGIGYGDLFLADTWAPFGSAPFGGDNAANGTRWQYGLVLDNRFTNPDISSAGVLSLYALSGGSNSENALMSDDFMTGNAIWRGGQEVAVDTSNAAKLVDNVGSWSVGDGYLRLVADLGMTNLFGNGELALHWAMSCANDVIEGKITGVPEPESVVLLSTGLVTLVLARRRKHKSA